jgi:hypothetical protein
MREGNVLVAGVYLESEVESHTNLSSSARNFMIYQRPTVEALDLWVNETGDSSYVRLFKLPTISDQTNKYIRPLTISSHIIRKVAISHPRDRTVQRMQRLCTMPMLLARLADPFR